MALLDFPGGKAGYGDYIRNLTRQYEAAGIPLIKGSSAPSVNLRALGISPGGPAGDDDLNALIAEAMARQGGDGDGRGFAPDPFSSTREAAELSQRYALEQLAQEQAFQAAQAEKNRELQRQQALEELKAERQRIFTDMLGTDPVRAVLFAMGVGGQIMPGGERFADLQPMQGAGGQATQTKTALQKLLGGQVGLGKTGVTGLPSIEQAAGAFSAGQGATGSVGDLGAARTLLTSGFGVGATPGAGAPGISREEALRRIAAVTPQGAF